MLLKVRQDTRMMVLVLALLVVSCYIHNGMPIRILGLRITSVMLMVILPLAASLSHNRLRIIISMTSVIIKHQMQHGKRWRKPPALEIMSLMLAAIAVDIVAHYLVY